MHNETPSDRARGAAARAGLDASLEATVFLDTVGFVEDGFGESGLPQDRAARMAARRAFVEMKQLFMHAAQAVEDRKGAWLRSQVRQAMDPIDLWLLRGPLLSSLRNGDEAGTRQLRAELYRRLDSTFPDTFGLGEAPSTLPAGPGGLEGTPWQLVPMQSSPFNPLRR